MFVERLKQFLKDIEKRANSQHNQTDIFMAVNKENTYHFIKMFKIVTQIDLKDKKILDVGFGVGDALNRFKLEGANPVGICVNPEEVAFIKDKGHEAYVMDQNFMSFEDNYFDIIWSRHCLEHSIMPFYTLHEYKRVMKSGAYLYVEVPAADTIYNHGDNVEHFSLFAMDMWLILMKRVFVVISNTANNMVGKNGSKDVFYSFILKKA